VLWAYVVLAVAPFAYAATREEYWDGVAPVSTLVVVGLLAALVLRKRWAWVVLLVFEAAVLISFAFDFTDALALAASVVRFGLLVSPPMQRQMRR
jgi:K+ transporter